jgi:hypothetical protein
MQLILLDGDKLVMLLRWTLEPGMWSLDNFGQTLIATAIDGATYQWSPIASNAAALTTRATISINNPTASVMTMVSDQDGHLFHLGTETIIGDTR